MSLPFYLATNMPLTIQTSLDLLDAQPCARKIAQVQQNTIGVNSPPSNSNNLINYSLFFPITIIEKASHLLYLQRVLEYQNIWQLTYFRPFEYWIHSGIWILLYEYFFLP